MRREKDSLGEKEVPKDAYYGIHTGRSLENFNLAGECLPLEIIHAMVRIKMACAQANVMLDQLPLDKGKAIERACRRVLTGEFDNQFPVDIFQAGSGTSSHMNVNEVLANLACEELGGQRGDRALVHPNDDLNQGQSTNNVFPSAIRVAAVEMSVQLISSVTGLHNALREKQMACEHMIKSARTHLQDAVPITVGQEFGAYARALSKDIRRIRQARDNLFELGVGGNAVGTGVNTRRDFRQQVVRALKQITDQPFIVAEDGIEATQFLTDMADFSAALRSLAIDLHKIANDLRLLSSGPRTGLGEIVLPAVEPGSSIMPGKINPSICEALNMACIQVIGYDHAVSMAAGAGQLELNTHMPLVGACLLKSIHLLERGCRMFKDKCVEGITVNEQVCVAHFENSVGLATVLNPKLGYDRVSDLVRESLRTDMTLKDLVMQKEIMSEEDWEHLIAGATEPNL